MRDESIERLLEVNGGDMSSTPVTYGGAMYKLEQLEAEVERLRAAIRELEQVYDDDTIERDRHHRRE